MEKKVSQGPYIHLWSKFHMLHTQGHQPWPLLWTQDGCSVLPCLERVKLGEKGTWFWVPLGCGFCCHGQERAALPAPSSARTAAPTALTPPTLPLRGVMSLSAQPDVISLLNLFCLRPHVNHFSHCFPPSSPWPGLPFLLLMCLERGERGPSWTQSRNPTVASCPEDRL